MQFYTNKGCLGLNGSSETSDFTLFWNNLFDNFNRNKPWKGLKKENRNKQNSKITKFLVSTYLKHFF